jgi:DNA-binding GntR family transcriptional regulator
MIISGELVAGQQIRQEEFAQQLGISRTPLLHALQVLKSEMLVESFPNRGMFVRQISLSELKDIFEYREAIETMSCRLASQRITAGEIKTLRDIFKPFVKKPELANLRNYQKADQLFHHALINYSGNTIFPRMISLGNVLLTTYQKGLIRPPAETLPEHLAIIDALEAGNARKGAQIMRQHLKKSIKLINKAMDDIVR